MAMDTRMAVYCFTYVPMFIYGSEYLQDVIMN